MFPSVNQTYIPAPPPDPTTPAIEYVRAHGTVIMISESGDTGLCVVNVGMVQHYIGVRLNPDATIADFMHRNVNRYVKCNPVPKTPIPADCDRVAAVDLLRGG